MIRFYGHLTCGTCRKAKNWLQSRDIPVQSLNIADDPPPRDTLARLLDEAGYSVRQLFNVSGQAYRERKLKDRLPRMSRDEALDLLASDGMLIKRPVIIDEDTSRATVGFKEEQFERVWGA